MAMKKTKTKKATIKLKKKKNSAPRIAAPDQMLREHLLYLLQGGGAHADFDAALGDWPVQLAGAKVANFPHTAWMLLEHMRLAQWDILEFSRNRKHVSPAWPQGYWPKSEAPRDEKAWRAPQNKLDARIGNQWSAIFAALTTEFEQTTPFLTFSLVVARPRCRPDLGASERRRAGINHDTLTATNVRFVKSRSRGWPARSPLISLRRHSFE